MLELRSKHPNCVTAMAIYVHQYATISLPQCVLQKYLQAFQVQPYDPFITLCIGILYNLHPCTNQFIV